jgi:hypothetical protein
MVAEGGVQLLADDAADEVAKCRREISYRLRARVLLADPVDELGERGRETGRGRRARSAPRNPDRALLASLAMRGS